jgi:hypothetical protein
MQRTVAIVAAVLMAATTDVAHFVLAETPHYSAWSAPLDVESAFPGSDPTLNTAALEGCPAISPDERTLYFATNRSGSLDIWRSQRGRADQPWGTPEPLPDVINRPDSREFCPTPLRNGKTLLFVSDRGGGCGLADIYVAREHPIHGWSAPEHLPCGVNSAREEASPFIVEYDDGTVELYFSSNRAGGFSSAGPDTDTDIYMTTLRRDGSFGAVLLVAGVNTAANDSRPNLRRDGLEMFFDSDRPAWPGTVIWTSTRSGPAAPWAEPVVVPNINSGAAEMRPFLSWDATRLFFGTTREGSSDLYVSTRLKNR